MHLDLIDPLPMVPLELLPEFSPKFPRGEPKFFILSLFFKLK